jgi:copper homeostasis protein
MTRRLLEICVDDIAGVHAAIAGGADRIELCAALALGGLTPSAGLVEAALNAARPAGVAVHAMVRPRGGDFRYDEAETALAMREAFALIAQGVDGLVFGAARDGALDEPMLAAWVSAVRAGGRPVSLTLHRAIDVTADPVAAVEVAATLGFDRILTSGGATSAEEGAEIIARMVARAGDRIRIMAGAGVRPDNAAHLLTTTGVRELHGSASAPLPESDARTAALGFDTPSRRRTDEATVRALRAAIDQGVSP